MFNLTVENMDNTTTIYRVTFSYDIKLGETRCVIFKGQMVNELVTNKKTNQPILVNKFEGEVITQGFARISEEDVINKVTFDKYLGRKSALKHAMQPKVFNEDTKEFEVLDIFEEDLRTKIWNMYFKLSPKSKK
jgi:hypothetical protein